MQDREVQALGSIIVFKSGTFKDQKPSIWYKTADAQQTHALLALITGLGVHADLSNTFLFRLFGADYAVINSFISLIPDIV